MFVGRVEELKQFLGLFDLKKTSLVVCRGRRRIGKSTLIQQFWKKIQPYYVLLCQRKAEGLGNDKQKPMVKIKTIGQILLFKNGTACPVRLQCFELVGSGF